ncbi:MAG TPA: GNAT family protein [Gaiellaceae bacterium]|nr:GNAT family protein [Gaiellaceae bacterium]
MAVTPPYRIETDRLVIRCYEPEDAPLLKEAVDSSIEHLLPWMPWARYEPQSLDQKIELLRMFRGQFDRDENYVYGIFDADESRQLGGSGLHPRGDPESIEIGYWIRADALRQGIATEVTAVLARTAIEQCAYQRVDIQVDPENEVSLRIPRRLGFTEEGRLRRRLDPKEDGGARRDSVLFSLLDDELPGSPCASFAYRGYDVIGRDS